MPKKRKRGNLARTIRAQVVPGANASADELRTPWLLVVQGAEVDLNNHILCDHPITIGRDPEADLTLRDGSISRAHCSVERDESTGRYVLVDLNSTNGTSVNGALVLERAPLVEGDKIFLGASVVRFSYADSVDLEYHEKLGEIVSTDALTGLASRRQYDALFEAAADKTLEGGLLTVIVMDMDGLKQINDTHGHQMGSYSITEVASLMSSVLGGHGHLARFGGDEFVGFFTGLPLARALELAESLRRRVVEHRFEREGVVVRPTLSIGVATYPDNSDDPGKLFDIADRALYVAKGAGRNRVACPAGVYKP